MAQIEVTEDSIRELVDADVFAQGAQLASRVSSLSVAGTLVEATVGGVRVTARLRPAGASGQCGLDERCECQEPAPCPHAVGALLAWVGAAEPDEAVALLADFEDALADAEPDAEYLNELADDAEALLADAPEGVRDLADRVVTILDGMQDRDDGDLAEVLARMEGLYLEARRVASGGSGGSTTDIY
jgi:uncharacterized Zn finger protein